MDKDPVDDPVPEVHVCLHEESINEWGAETRGLVPGLGIRNGVSKQQKAMGNDSMGLVAVRTVVGGVVMLIACNHKEGKLMVGHLSFGEGFNQEVDPDVVEIMAFADLLCYEQLELC